MQGSVSFSTGTTFEPEFCLLSDSTWKLDPSSFVRLGADAFSGHKETRFECGTGRNVYDRYTAYVNRLE